MFERFSHGARAVVVLAQGHARRLHHGHLGTEHLLLGLLEQPGTVSGRLLVQHGLDKASAERAMLRLLGPCHGSEQLDAEALEAIGIDLSAIRERVEAAFGPGALDRDPGRRRRERALTGGHLPFTGRAKKVLELSLREATRLGNRYIGDGHILLGILDEGGGLAAKVIADAGIDFVGLRAELEREIPAEPPQA